MRAFVAEELSKYTSFRTGGKADTVFFPETEEELCTLLKRYPDACVLGNCSNTLVKDEGVRGEVIFTTDLKKINVDGTTVTASAGVSLTPLALAAQKNALTGMEFLYGIPGTVGGALFMNAGAYGGEIGTLITSVRLYDCEKGVFELTGAEMDFGYRKSILQTQRYTVLSAVFSLARGNEESIKAQMDDLLARRRTSQPLELPSCGSTFKRPEGHYAGRLIEECGLKGMRVGGAMVSTRHAGFIVNAGGATSADILALISRVKQVVYAKTGVMLEEEIRIL